MLGVLSVHLGKVVHIAHEDGGLDHLGHVGAGLLEDGLDVGEDETSLLGDGVLVVELASGRVKRNLARCKQHAVDLDGLAVRTNGLGSLVSRNDLLALVAAALLALLGALAFTLTATGALLLGLALLLVARAFLGALALTLTATGALLALLLVARALLWAFALTLTATGALLLGLALLLVARALLGALALTLTATGALLLGLRRLTLLSSRTTLAAATTLHLKQQHRKKKFLEEINQSTKH